MLPPREAALRAKRRTIEQMSKTPFAITQQQHREQQHREEQHREQQQQEAVVASNEMNIQKPMTSTAKHASVDSVLGGGQTAPTPKDMETQNASESDNDSERAMIEEATEETKLKTIAETEIYKIEEDELKKSISVPSPSTEPRRTAPPVEAADTAEPGEPWAAAFEAELASTRRRELREAEAEAKQQEEDGTDIHSPRCDQTLGAQQLFGPEEPEETPLVSKAERNARLVELRKQVYAQHRLRDEAARIMQEKGLIDVDAPEELTAWWQSSRVVYFIGSGTPDEYGEAGGTGARGPPRADNVNLLELNLSPDPAFSKLPHCLGFESRADALNFCHFMQDLNDDDADIGLAHAAHMRQSVRVVPRSPADIRALCAARGAGATVLPDGELVMQRGMCLGDVFAALGNDDAVGAVVLRYMETQSKLIQQLAGNGVGGGMPGFTL